MKEKWIAHKGARFSLQQNTMGPAIGLSPSWSWSPRLLGQPSRSSPKQEKASQCGKDSLTDWDSCSQSGKFPGRNLTFWIHPSPPSNTISDLSEWLEGTSEYQSIYLHFHEALCGPLQRNIYNQSYFAPLSRSQEFFLPGALFAWKQSPTPFYPLSIQTPARTWCLLCLFC